MPENGTTKPEGEENTNPTEAIDLLKKVLPMLEALMEYIEDEVYKDQDSDYPSSNGWVRKMYDKKDAALDLYNKIIDLLPDDDEPT